MFKNYLILAWRVLGRNKFFTFISLFGISFTLAILMLIISFLQTELGTDGPWKNRNSMVLINQARMENVVPDTTMVVDSVLVNGVQEYDTTYTYDESSRSVSVSSPSVRFLETHFSNLDGAENYTFYSPQFSFNVFKNNAKIVLHANYCDYRYWDIFPFDFIEGRGFDESSFNQAEPVAIITDKKAMEYFGKDKGILGEELKMDGISFKIMGVIKEPNSSFFRSDLYVPYTIKQDLTPITESYLGVFNAIFKTNENTSPQLLKEEIINKTKLISMDPIPDYNLLIVNPKTINEEYAQDLIYHEDASKSKKWLFLILTGFVILFVLLPTLNLINLNISRILERASEIGVRKSFGAHNGNILGQFIFENIILTLLGGIIGFLISLGLMNMLNASGLMNNLKLTIDIKFFLLSLIVVVLFGIISGFLPAYRMSKMHIVNALKENQL